MGIDRYKMFQFGQNGNKVVVWCLGARTLNHLLKSYM